MGEWGDFFGGVLNPLLTFLTFMGLLITIILQQSELRESRREFKRSADALIEQSSHMEKQKFENTFFNMNSFFNECVTSFEVTDNESNNMKGRGVFMFYHTQLLERIRSPLYDKYSPNDQVIKGVQSFIFHYNHEIEHYFTQIKNILKFIDASMVTDKTFYADLLSSQLSLYEKGILFHYAFGDKEYFELVDKYNLLSGLVLKHFTFDPREFNPYKSLTY